MPGEEYYAKMAKPQEIRAFVRHHFGEKTRHISKTEAEMLLEAAALLEELLPEPGLVREMS